MGVLFKYEFDYKQYFYKKNAALKFSFSQDHQVTIVNFILTNFLNTHMPNYKDIHMSIHIH